jgi:hypothetical protein
VPKTPNPSKNSLNRQKSPTAKNPLAKPQMANQIGAKYLPKFRHFLVNQRSDLRSKNPYSFIITFLIAPDVIDF